MNTALLLAILVILGLLFFFFVMRVIAAFLRRVLKDDVARLTRGKNVIRLDWGANYFGRQAGGRGQVRGNGALILTGRELIFILAYPRRETVIPLTGITGVSLARSHRGRTIFQKLLKVEFAAEPGAVTSDPNPGADAIAWSVPDPAAWQQAVESARRRAVAR